MRKRVLLVRKVRLGGSGGRLPADKGVARSGGPGSGPEEETGQILTGVILHQIREMFPDRSSEAEVVVVMQVIAHTMVFV